MVMQGNLRPHDMLLAKGITVYFLFANLMVGTLGIGGAFAGEFVETIIVVRHAEKLMEGYSKSEWKRPLRGEGWKRPGRLTKIAKQLWCTGVVRIGFLSGYPNSRAVVDQVE